MENAAVPVCPRPSINFPSLGEALSPLPDAQYSTLSMEQSNKGVTPPDKSWNGLFSKTMASSLRTLTSAAEPESSGCFQFEPGPNKDISLCLQDQEYSENIKEVQFYLDKVRKIVRPGCSQEVLNTAVISMSSLVEILSAMSSKPKSRASL